MRQASETKSSSGWAGLASVGGVHGSDASISVGEGAFAGRSLGFASPGKGLNEPYDLIPGDLIQVGQVIACLALDEVRPAGDSGTIRNRLELGDDGVVDIPAQCLVRAFLPLGADRHVRRGGEVGRGRHARIGGQAGQVVLAPALHGRVTYAQAGGDTALSLGAAEHGLHRVGALLSGDVFSRRAVRTHCTARACPSIC